MNEDEKQIIRRLKKLWGLSCFSDITVYTIVKNTFNFQVEMMALQQQKAIKEFAKAWQNRTRQTSK